MARRRRWLAAKPGRHDKTLILIRGVKLLRPAISNSVSSVFKEMRRHLQVSAGLPSRHRNAGEEGSARRLRHDLTCGALCLKVRNIDHAISDVKKLSSRRRTTNPGERGGAARSISVNRKSA